MGLLMIIFLEGIKRTPRNERLCQGKLRELHEIITIKELRQKYHLPLVDAKKIMDFAKLVKTFMYPMFRFWNKIVVSNIKKLRLILSFFVC